MIIRKIKEVIFPILLLTTLCSCDKATNSFTHIATTKNSTWVKNITSSDVIHTDDTHEVTIDLAKKNQTVDGFGACFNELGWTSLSLLSEDDRSDIMSELFTPQNGANFNICRMPIAANDFATDWYSYNEVNGDYEMKYFSIDRDEAALIPFIKSALSCNPSLAIWASPWSPPSWMKVNNHYASAYNGDSPKVQYHNGLAKEDQGFEGDDMFIQTDENMVAYALYFSKFIKEYRNHDIDIFAVMPQNEFNSAQVFPSCCWKATSLAKFMGKYLIPEMEKLGVKTFFGTVERANVDFVDAVLTNNDCKNRVSGVGFQWAGKDAVSSVHKKYPDVTLYQTEQECGNGKNDWNGVMHSWDLLKHYFDSGVSAYMYWNISLLEGGISRWGWAQNSLIVVNPSDNTYRYTFEYYLMKHISHFVKVGARHITTPKNFEGLVFENIDESIVILYCEKEGVNRTLKLNISGREVIINIEANSINTVVI